MTLSFTRERQLKVSLDNRGGAGSTFTIAPEQFTCEKGRLLLRKGSRWAGSGPTYGLFAIGKVSTAVELYRAADYLIVKKRARSVGVVVVIPWTARSEEWHRFQRMARLTRRAPYRARHAGRRRKAGIGSEDDDQSKRIVRTSWSNSTAQSSLGPSMKLIWKNVVPFGTAYVRARTVIVPAFLVSRA